MAGLQIVFLVTLCSIWVRADDGPKSGEIPVIEYPWYLTLDDVDHYLEGLSHLYLEEGSDCNRKCVEGQKRICYNKLRIENYHAMGPACGNCSRGEINDCFKTQCVTTDGYEKGILTINRQIPGPMIVACEGDLIVMDVINLMHSESFSIHWHGILMELTPYMDGVPYITQCPINPSNLFRYKYPVKRSGTNFYHSHSGMQRYNGAFGSLIVKKSNDRQKVHYDKDLIEHVIVFCDFSHESVEMFFIGLPTRPPGLLPQTILINGLGRYQYNETSFQAATPFSTFYVTSGYRYRMRLINAGSTVCPLQIQFQEHRMTIIATDGADVEPFMVDTLIIHTGERYDVVINATKQTGLYWIHTRLIGPCLPRNITQMAVLSYQPGSFKAGLFPPNSYNIQGFDRGVALGEHEISECGANPNERCVSELHGYEEHDILNVSPDIVVPVTFEIKQLNTSTFFHPTKYHPFFNIRNDEIFLGTANGISYTPLKYPLLSQRDHISVDNFCDKHNPPKYCEYDDACICTHVINLKKDSIVEFILIDISDSTFPVSHPIHFHGYAFYVTCQHRVPSDQRLTIEKVKELIAQGVCKDNPSPPTKDTVAVQNQGFVVIRFKADNPGAWLVHCHIEDHMAFGMGFAIIVDGTVPPVPPHFPTCGPFPPLHK